MDRPPDRILVAASLGCLGVLLLAAVAAVAFAGGMVFASVQRQSAVAPPTPAVTMVPAPPLAQPTPGVTPGNPRAASGTPAATAAARATGTAPRGNPANPAATSTATTTRATATSRATAGATPASRPVIRAIDLPANDLVYDPASQRIWASVPATGGQWGNSVVPIDPATGVVGPAIFVGSEPNRLALSDDGRYLYVGLDGAAAVRRVDLQTQQAELQFPLGIDSFSGPFYAEDIAVLPGRPEAIAVARRNEGLSPRHEGVAIYVDGVALPNATPDHTGSNSIEFCSSAELLYGYNNETSEYGFRRMAVDDQGVTVRDVTPSLIQGYYQTIVCAGDLIYATAGAVVDPEAKRLVGTYPGVGGGSRVAVDTASGRAFFLVSGTPTSTGSYQVLAFDRPTFRLLGSFDVPSLIGDEAHPASSSGRSLVRWGLDGLAFQSESKVFLVQSALVGGTVAVPPAAVPTVAAVPTGTPTAPAAPPAARLAAVRPCLGTCARRAGARPAPRER